MASSAIGDLEEIDDPGEYNQRRRLRAIHDARERVLEQRRHALDLKALNRIGERQYQSIVREAVQSFILEIEQLLRRYQADAEPNLDEDSDARPPSWYLEEAPLGTVLLKDAGVFSFYGLQSVLEFPDPYVAEWEEKPDPPSGFSTHPDAEAEKRTRKQQIPEQVLLNAVRAGMQFLSTIGLDAEIKETTPEFGFDELDEERLEELKELDQNEVVIDDR